MVSGQASGSSTRVDSLIAAYGGGMRVETLREDSSPWVRKGIAVLQEGGKLTEEMLLEADSSQNMRSSEVK